MSNAETPATKPAARKAASAASTAKSIAERATQRNTAALAKKAPARKPAKRMGVDVATLVLVPEVGTTLPVKPARKSTGRKVEVTAELAEALTAKTPAARKAATRKLAAKVAEVTYDEKKVVAKIKALRAKGLAWRPLSVALNDAGITTVRGKAWSANGSTAFLLARKHGIA